MELPVQAVAKSVRFSISLTGSMRGLRAQYARAELLGRKPRRRLAAAPLRLLKRARRSSVSSDAPGPPPSGCRITRISVFQNCVCIPGFQLYSITTPTTG